MCLSLSTYEVKMKFTRYVCLCHCYPKYSVLVEWKLFYVAIKMSALKNQLYKWLFELKGFRVFRETYACQTVMFAGCKHI